MDNNSGLVAKIHIVRCLRTVRQVSAGTWSKLVEVFGRLLLMFQFWNRPFNRIKFILPISLMDEIVARTSLNRNCFVCRARLMKVVSRKQGPSVVCCVIRWRYHIYIRQFIWSECRRQMKNKAELCLIGNIHRKKHSKYHGLKLYGFV